MAALPAYRRLNRTGSLHCPSFEVSIFGLRPKSLSPSCISLAESTFHLIFYLFGAVRQVETAKSLFFVTCRDFGFLALVKGA